MCIVKIWPKIKIRKDLMNSNFHSIWLELEDPSLKINSTLIAGFYRVWTHNLENSEASQIKRWKIFTNQINSAAKNDANIVIIGDSNLDYNKWNDPLFAHKEMVFRLTDTLEQNGMEVLEIGNTYQADHAQSNGKIAESALDHIYMRLNDENQHNIRKLKNSSTDHVPIVITVSKQISNESHFKSITKRSYKNFSSESWNDILSKKKWDGCEINNESCQISMLDNLVKMFLTILKKL